MWLIDEDELNAATNGVELCIGTHAQATLDGRAVLVDGCKLVVVDPLMHLRTFTGRFGEDLTAAAVVGFDMPDDLGNEGHLVAVSMDTAMVYELGAGEAVQVFRVSTGALRRLEFSEGALKVNDLRFAPGEAGDVWAGGGLAVSSAVAAEDAVCVRVRGVEVSMGSGSVYLTLNNRRTRVCTGNRTVGQLLAMTHCVDRLVGARVHVDNDLVYADFTLGAVKGLHTRTLRAVCHDTAVVVDQVEGTWATCPALAEAEDVRWLAADDADDGGFTLAGAQAVDGGGVQPVLAELMPDGRLRVTWRGGVVETVYAAVVAGDRAAWFTRTGHECTLIENVGDGQRSTPLNGLNHLTLDVVNGQPAAVQMDVEAGVSRLFTAGRTVDVPMAVDRVDLLSGDAVVARAWSAMLNASEYLHVFTDGQAVPVTWASFGSRLLAAGDELFVATPSNLLLPAELVDGQLRWDERFLKTHAPVQAVAKRAGVLWALLADGRVEQPVPTLIVD